MRKKCKPILTISTRAVQAEPSAVSETAAPEAEEAEAELDGEDIYMEEEESGGWIEEAEE